MESFKEVVLGLEVSGGWDCSVQNLKAIYLTTWDRPGIQGGCSVQNLKTIYMMTWDRPGIQGGSEYCG